MIKLFARMVPMLARARRGSPVEATATVASGFRVPPHDIDINLHLNNGRHLQRPVGRPLHLRAQLPYPLAPLVLPDHVHSWQALDEALGGRVVPAQRLFVAVQG